MPLTWAARPAANAGRPTIAGADDGPLPPSALFGENARSSVCLNVAAVTGSFDGGEKRKPGRITNVHVRPSPDTVGIAAATSGRRRPPAAPPTSG
jgi:hypothetical protein